MKKFNAKLPLLPRNNWRMDANRNSVGAGFSSFGSRSSKSSHSNRDSQNRGAPPNFTNLSCLRQLIDNNDCEDLLLLVCSDLEQFKVLIIQKLNTQFLPTVTELVAKLCSSTFTANKYKILNITLKRNFFEVCHAFITSRILDSENVGSIWKNFERCLLNALLIFDHALHIMPSLVWFCINRTIKLLDCNITIIEREKLVIFSEKFKTLFKDIKETLFKLECQYAARTKKSGNKDENNIEPPEDFRMLSLYPTLNELITPERNFVRENVTTGKYKNVKHYLDIHFRLLREDFINPIRQDICDYLNKTRRKFFNIRIHKNVKFIEQDINKQHLCYRLHVTVTTGMRESLNHSRCKRLMHGSLLICTNNDFRSAIFGIVVDIKNLLKNQTLLISVINGVPQCNTEYTMVECIVYFEPYYQVLKAFHYLPENSLPMANYILDADTSIHKPVYLKNNRLPTIKNLNQSQEKAMLAAFSQEFVVIQGPPGTGKTFLGLKIVQELLNVSNEWALGPILIISLTNHALDQFLGGLLGYTSKIVRLGSQSQDTRLKKYALHEVRQRQKQKEKKVHGQHTSFTSRTISSLYADLEDGEGKVKCLKKLLEQIKNNNRLGIFNIKLFQTYLSQDIYNMFFEYFTEEDFMYWLLEDTNENFSDGTENSDIYFLDDMCSEFFRDSFEINFFDPKNEIYTVSVFEVEQVKKQMENIIYRIKILTEDITGPQFDSFDVEYYEAYIKFLTEKRIFLEEHLQKDYESLDLEEFTNIADAFYLPTEIRWKIYMYLLNIMREYIEQAILETITDYMDTYSRLDELRQSEDIILLKQMKIIGMTTTCAARLRHVLEKIKSPIVVVEEAAEVLEAHIVSSLTDHCQHLILLGKITEIRTQKCLKHVLNFLQKMCIEGRESLKWGKTVFEDLIILRIFDICDNSKENNLMTGDHKQLRPTTSDYVLEKQYKLNISLFERMVNNNIQCYTLNVQHRMRPEISKLLCPSIYPDLKDNESVYLYPPVRGTEYSLFFINHSEPEDDFGDSSKFNIHEARFLVKFTEYLLKNGYNPSEITILAAYVGQVVTLKQEISSSKVKEVNAVHITAVDNFQGEENKIILLSLVRSNDDNNVGFLSTENRICVALSRAKEGFFIMGNMTQLCASSKLWKKINASLEEQEAVGEHLPLRCKKHNKLTLVSKPVDFRQVKNGGCDEICNEVLDCGHICVKVCHTFDLDHSTTFKCTETCNRKVCDIEYHLCQKACSEKCGNCQYMVMQRLPCAHDQWIRCSDKKRLEEIKCQENITIEAKCGHKVTKMCHQMTICTDKVQVKLDCGHTAEKPCNILIHDFQCPHLCKELQVCGHICERKCHNKNSDHEDLPCSKMCIKKNLRCNQSEHIHTSEVPCYAFPSLCKVRVRKTCLAHRYEFVVCHKLLEKCSTPCKKTLPCKHKCGKECYKHGRCGPCTKMVRKTSECGHGISTVCGNEPNPTDCKSKCQRKLPCGHNCPNLCAVPCTTICKQICNKKLKCGHKCINKCAEECGCQYKPIPECGHEILVKCDETPLHEKCVKTCRKDLKCGHKCKELCNIPCPTKCFRCSIIKTINLIKK